uniref:D-aminoacyl-tRNA deacylase n=1 Tax=Neogobius melanostomus TaxID=47308 RepID=A0A8C6TQM3_9GOBI
MLDGCQSHVRPLEARVVVQQCSRAKVKTRDEVNGAEPQYAEVRAGLVVYVCFFEGATEDTFFHGCLSRGRRPVSVLELPGEILLLPQESLGWERGPNRSMRSRGVSEARRGSQLYSSLASRCRETLLQSGATGGAVEQGVYGQRQEVEMSSSEPMSHVLEF